MSANRKNMFGNPNTIYCIPMKEPYKFPKFTSYKEGFAVVGYALDAHPHNNEEKRIKFLRQSMDSVKYLLFIISGDQAKELADRIIDAGFMPKISEKLPDGEYVIIATEDEHLSTVVDAIQNPYSTQAYNQQNYMFCHQMGIKRKND